jgi:hypothetical protein
MVIDMDALQKHSPRTYRTAICYLDLGQTSGKQDVDLDSLPQITRGEIMEFLGRLSAQKAKHMPPEPTPLIDLDEVLREQEADMKRAADQAHAINRLNEYAAAGLEDTEANANLIKEFVNNSAVHGYWSREIVDAAIANLGPRGSNQLTWKPKAAPAPPPPPEPTEVLADWQLPLDANEKQMKNASVKALQDLIARRRAATGQQYARSSGSFGSRF